MAPARRKGSGRAAAAAAVARRQWKVGDLVLAKMKGFPAWPAVITDPKKWGYSSDRKKLLVFFFGTKQIAFCNHVDIDAFTEEKKKTLLSKRQGKGADFVRAVEEIIDCYEKSQKQNHDNTSNSGDEGVVSDAGNLEGSGCKLSIGSKDGIQPIRACQYHGCNSPMQNNDAFKSNENSIAPNNNEDQHNLDADIKHLAEKVSIIDQLRQTPFVTSTSLRKRSRNVLSQTCVIPEKAPSLRRSRSSTRVDPSKLQRAELTISKDDPADISLVTNIEQDEFAAGNGLPNDVLDNSVCNDVDKHMSTDTLISDGTHEDVGSGITTVESKGILFHRDGASESKCEDEHSLFAQIDENNKIDGQADKRQITESMSVYGAMDEEINSQVDISKNLSSSLNSCNKINERIANADGDEHLPLVKRARARKGNLSLEEKQSVVAGTKPEKLSFEHCDKDNIPFPKNSPTVMDAKNTVSISSSNGCSKSKGSDMLLKVQSFHFRGSTVDAEAALPPSKRLHRALEAMSANAAEARDDGIEAPGVPEISNGCSDSSDNTARKPQELHEQNISENVILNLSHRSPSCPVTEIQELTGEMTSDAKASNLNRSPQHEECTKITTIDRSPMSSASTAKTITKEDLVQTPEPCLSESSDKQVSEKTALSASEKSLPILGMESKILQQKKDWMEDTTKDQFASIQVDKMEGEEKLFHSDIQKIKVENCSALPLDNTPVTLPVVSGCSISIVASGSIKSSNTLGKEKYGERDMKQSTAEIKHVHTPKDSLFSPDSTPMKALIAAAQAKRLYSRSSSLSDNVTDIKPSSDGMSSPSPFHTEDSSEHLSGHSEKTNCQLSGSRSPDINLHLKSSTHQCDVNGSRLESLSIHEHKVSNKLSGPAEASASLQSFEALVCILTRAKESIVRATHYAIECAKHDVACQVVDILVRNLEKEPSLHRRVDMLFLVDSITRFCRGQKGVAGDVYPSLFQSVLGRLLSAAAPPGNTAWENRRQCLKVLRLWLERKTLPESVVRHHIRAIESINEGSFTNGFSRRPSRTERALDDPVREMEGMLVDEYGSNTSFQLPGLLNSHVFEDIGGSDSDEKSFEAVTPEHDSKIDGDTGSTLSPVTEKHKHILEDVDGELEMEDVAPPSEIEASLSHLAVEVDTQHASQHQFEQHHLLPFAPPLPEDRPPTPPPLPSSPPPVIPPCPSPSTLLSVPSTSNRPADFSNSNSYIGAIMLLQKNVQNHLPHPNTRPIEQNINSMSSDAAPYYAPGYRDLPNHVLPPSSSLGPSCTYRSNSSSHLSMNQGITSLPFGSESSSNKAYHLQPPPPTVSNQFSYVQSEQQMQPWGKCSSSHLEKLFQFGHDQQVGNLYGNGRGTVQYESCGFSAAVPSGHMHSEKTESSSCSLPYYGSHPESSPMLNQCWSHPPRPPNYQYPVPPSRPLENHLPRMNGAPAYWRPR